MPVGKSTALPIKPVRRILDSGSGNHLIGQQDLTPEELRAASDIEDEILLSTGNGIVQPEEEIELPVSALGGVGLKHNIFENSPAVASLVQS